MRDACPPCMSAECKFFRVRRVIIPPAVRAQRRGNNTGFCLSPPPLPPFDGFWGMHVYAHAKRGMSGMLVGTLFFDRPV